MPALLELLPTRLLDSASKNWFHFTFYLFNPLTVIFLPFLKSQLKHSLRIYDNQKQLLLIATEKIIKKQHSVQHTHTNEFIVHHFL